MILFIDDGEDKNSSMLQGVSPAADEKDFVIWLIVTVGVVMFLGKQTFLFKKKSEFFPDCQYD